MFVQRICAVSPLLGYSPSDVRGGIRVANRADIGERAAGAAGELESSAVRAAIRKDTHAPVASRNIRERVGDEISGGIRSQACAA
jgi:hypothetical protein